MIARSAGPIPEAPLIPRMTLGVMAGLFLVLGVLGGLRLASLTNRANRPLDVQPTYRVNLNRASLAELEQLPGLGPTLARRVQEHRETEGEFRDVSELLNVKGIGPILFELLQDRVTLGTGDEVTRKPPGGVNPNTSRGPSKAMPEGTQIDPNRATLEELNQLPGIGPVLAGRIVESRAALPFKSVEDLRRVKGIGPKTLEAVRPFVRIE